MCFGGNWVLGHARFRPLRVAICHLANHNHSGLKSLEALFFTYEDPTFPNSGKTRSVLIPATGRQLKFTFWLQPGKAPVVYIVPGLGSHRLAKTSLALAELVYKKGFSAVCVSSPFNSEFMENASTVALLAYLPADGRDLHVALTEIDRHLNALYPDRLGEKALMGYSMGALQSLFVAAIEPTNQLPLIKFDRYVAIDTPVRLQHGVSELDDYYRAPLSWPVAVRTDNLENTFLKVVALSKSTLTSQTSLPFSAIESKFLLMRAYCDTRFGISGANRCIRKSFTIPFGIILRSLRLHTIMLMALDWLLRKH